MFIARRFGLITPRVVTNFPIWQSWVDPRAKMTRSELEPATFRPVAHCRSKLRHSELYFLSLATLSFCINQLVFGSIEVSTEADEFGELIDCSTEQTCGIGVRRKYLGVLGGEFWLSSYI